MHAGFLHANDRTVSLSAANANERELIPRLVGAFVSPRAADMDVNWGIALDLCERTADVEVARAVAKAVRKELKLVLGLTTEGWVGC